MGWMILHNFDIYLQSRPKNTLLLNSWQKQTRIIIESILKTKHFLKTQHWGFVKTNGTMMSMSKESANLFNSSFASI